MKNKSTKVKELLWYKFPTFIGDLIIYYIALWLLNFPNKEIPFTIWPTENAMLPLQILFCFVISLTIFPIKINERRMRYSRVIRRAICQVTTTLILFILISTLFSKKVEIQFYLIFYIIVLTGVTLWHIIIKVTINILRLKGKNRKNIVFVGADKNAISLYKSLKKGYGVDGYNIHGFFSDFPDENLPDGAIMKGKINEIFDYLSENDIDEVYCSINPAISNEFVNNVIKVCDKNFITFYYVPNMEGYAHRKHIFEEFGNVNVLRLREEPLMNPLNRVIKRTFDIIISGLFLITVFPFVFFFAAIGIKRSSSGPIFFKQARTGYRGNSFGCLKFRTMHVNADSDKVQATANDPRKFKFGDFLRRTSIDELPQVINIFKGDMSLIGPRPHMEYHTEVYSQLIDEYLVRHRCKPGLSGWAQVNGCRGETKTVEQMKERVEHDVWYIEHWTFWLDLQIIFMTIRQVIKGDEQAY